MINPLPEQLIWLNLRYLAGCRWFNTLDPSLNLGSWTEEEDNKLKAAITEHGHCWSKIALCMPGRTDSQCRR